LASSPLIRPYPVGVTATPTTSPASVGMAQPAVPGVCWPTSCVVVSPPPPPVLAVLVGPASSAMAGLAASPASRTPTAAPRSSLVAANRDSRNREE
jgi:hypothetical protein